MKKLLFSALLSVSVVSGLAAMNIPYFYPERATTTSTEINLNESFALHRSSGRSETKIRHYEDPSIVTIIKNMDLNSFDKVNKKHVIEYRKADEDHIFILKKYKEGSIPDLRQYYFYVFLKKTNYILEYRTTE